MTTCGTYVNLDQVRETIKELSKFRLILIKDLSRHAPQIKKKFDQFLQLIEEVKNSDAYDEIFRIVEEETKNYNVAIPGSVGAYFKGCLLPVNFPDNPSCSEICVSSFQPPNTIDGWYTCGKIVIRAKWRIKLSEAGCINPMENYDDFTAELVCNGQNPGYLLIDHTTLSEFPGFSSEEKIKIKRLGLNSCKLLSVSPSGRDYRDLLNGFHSIDNLPSRVTRPDGLGESKNNTWLVMFIFLVALVGVGIFSLLKLSSENEREI